MQDGPSISYINQVVLNRLRERGITITPDCRITNDDNLSAAEVVALLKDDGWSWPRQWYRQNRNYFQYYAGARHLEKEVESGRWIHIVVSPAVRRADVALGRARKIRDWSLPPNIELHAEKEWLRPSSFGHLWSFLADRLKRLVNRR